MPTLPRFMQLQWRFSVLLSWAVIALSSYTYRHRIEFDMVQRSQRRFCSRLFERKTCRRRK
ncbi:protein of unknown function [Agrobacterium pusense]|uniref:Uncharacterized protein n=1 Tax=Agrobacterium pusense TaxID=648995 RepID=U4PVG2_9HYPH|nr:protein of unknown function [Agrobacterium pusense]